jgi:thiamine pyrophosphate-dependent acetolactate synthase large subunit-like protein
MGPFGTLAQHGLDYWPNEAKIIQVEADHTNLGLVKKITVGIHGDARATALALLQKLEGNPLAALANKAQRAITIAAEKAAWEEELDGCTRDKCCASWKKPCHHASWCPPTLAISTRWPTATCALKNRAASSRP